MTIHLTVRGVFFLAALLFSFEAFAQAEDKYEIVETNDLQYFSGADAESERHRLNIVAPVSDDLTPLLLWVPGGAWAVGDRYREMPIARKLAQEGIAVAVVEHRMSPGAWISPDYPSSGATHPDHIVDVARAFAWLKQNAATYGADPSNLFVGGFSSGAHLSALLATDPKYLSAHGFSLLDIKAAIPVSGAYDMALYYDAMTQEMGPEKADGHVLGVFGTAGALADASPINHFTDSPVPMLVLSESDTYDYTRIFEDAVAKKNKAHLIQFVHFRDETHRSLFNNLGSRNGSYPPRQKIIDYVLHQR